MDTGTVYTCGTSTTTESGKIAQSTSTTRSCCSRFQRCPSISVTIFTCWSPVLYSIQNCTFTTCATRVVSFLAASIYVFVCQLDNSQTVREIIMKCSEHHPVVERADKFENGLILVRGSDLTFFMF